METDTESVLYEQIGGADAIREIVAVFYDRVRADPTLSPYFEAVPMERLLAMQTEFFGAALGGPVTYSGVALSQAHGRLGITREDFSRFAGHLFDTLDDRGCDRELVRSVVGRVSLYVDDIVGGYGEDG